MEKNASRGTGVEMKLEFKPEDFKIGELVSPTLKDISAVINRSVAEAANTRLAEMLKDAVRVYMRDDRYEYSMGSDKDSGVWREEKDCFHEDTHTALLVNIEEIKS